MQILLNTGTAFTVGSWSIQWYGIIMAVALLAGIFITMRMFKRKGLNPESVLDLALVVVPSAIVGARFHYVLWSWQEFTDRPFWHVFAVWEGGLAIFGAIIFGMVALFIYAWKKKIPFLTLCDLMVPALALGQAIGRWGNFCNQEVYGQVVTNPALQFFPMSVFINATGTWHQALFFYESCWNLLIFCLLFFVLPRKERRTGTAVGLYFLMYGVARAILEGFRTETYIQRTAGLPMNMLVAVLAALAGFFILQPWRLLPGRKRSKKVVEVPDDLVLISSRGKLKVDGEGNVLRDEEMAAENEAVIAAQAETEESEEAALDAQTLAQEAEEPTTQEKVEETAPSEEKPEDADAEDPKAE